MHPFIVKTALAAFVLSTTLVGAHAAMGGRSTDRNGSHMGGKDHAVQADRDRPGRGTDHNHDGLRGERGFFGRDRFANKTNNGKEAPVEAGMIYSAQPYYYLWPIPARARRHGAGQ